MPSKKKNKKNNLKKYFLISIIAIAIIAGFKAYQFYQDIKSPNIDLKGEKYSYIYIPSGSYYSHVKAILKESGYLINEDSFDWVAQKKKYPENVKAGKFKLTNKMSNNQLVNLLRSGKQTPVKLVFNKVRTIDKFAEIIGKQIEASSSELIDLLTNEEYINSFDKTNETILSLFIPNTYEFFWNTSAESFIKRMAKEQKRFWDEKRLKKAKNLGLSADEIYVLASIVEEETTKNDEKKRLAGVYYNRLKKRMRLQADPTVKYAVGDFGIKRVLNKHLEIDSPYNTYRNYGLPPGPICIPSISSIDAVLNLEKHNYLYFCAKDDFSGYHAFAKTLKQHNLNAAKYRRALNRNRIYR